MGVEGLTVNVEPGPIITGAGAVGVVGVIAKFISMTYGKLLSEGHAMRLQLGKEKADVLAQLGVANAENINLRAQNAGLESELFANRTRCINHQNHLLEFQSRLDARGIEARVPLLELPR